MFFFILALPPVSGTMLNAPVSPAWGALPRANATLPHLVNSVFLFCAIHGQNDPFSLVLDFISPYLN